MIKLRLGRKAATRLGRAIALIPLCIGAFFFLLPFVWVLSTSLKTDAQVYVSPPVWIPNPVKWSNYPEALTYLPFARYFRNTMEYCLMVVIGTLLTSSMVAYGFARLDFPGRDFLFMLLISTMMLPWAVRIIPVFLMWKRLGLTNTLYPLWVPSFLGGGALNIFLLRQFFMTVPLDLSDAARIDGCSEPGIYWRIIMPLSGPALTVVAVFQFLWAWNDFIRPLIYLNDSAKYTMALGLQLFIGLEQSRYNLLMAAAAAMTMPVLIIFAFAQRYMVQGVTLTGLKG